MAGDVPSVWIERAPRWSTVSWSRRVLGLSRGIRSRPESLVVLLGAVVLLGWLFDVEALKRISPRFESMKANTALALLLAALGLWLLRARPVSLRRRAAGKTCGVAVTAIGLLTLAEYALGWQLGIDQLLFHDAAAHGGGSLPGRMGENTAACFVLLGLGLLLLDARRPRAIRPAEAAAVAVWLIALIPLVGYMYGVDRLEKGFAAHTTQMALHTSLALLALASALFFARPEHGAAALALSPRAGGAMLRQLLLPMIVILVASGWLRLEGERRGYYDTDVGHSLFAIAVIVMSATIIWLTAGSLDQTDAERERAVIDLRLEQQRLRAVFEQVPAGLVIAEAPSGRFILANRQFEAILGQSVEGYRRYGVFHPDGRPYEPPEYPLARSVAGVTVHGEELLYLLPGGDRILLEVNSAPIWNDAGETIAAVAAFRDVTLDREALEEIQRLNEELEQRVEARTVELERTNEELEAFTYSVSHDLRAPLRAIDGFARMLGEELGADLADRAARRLAVIRESTRSMGDLIDGLLAFSRLGRQALTRRPVDTGAVVREALAQLQPELETRSVELEIGGLPTVTADPLLLRQVFLNLLSNAVKFTRGREPTRIEVAALDEDGKPVFFVRDNGVGFDRRYESKLFGVFERLHHAEDYEGTGLGLALVRRIVERHGGRIWAESELGAGATFYFSLGGEPT